jgi:hypothetical protein
MTTNYAVESASEQGAQLAFPFLGYERSPILFGLLVTADPLLRKRRQQALLAMSFLGDDLIKYREAIDRGEPLIAAIAKTWNTSAAAVRRVRALPSEDIDEALKEGVDLASIARAFDIAGARHTHESGELSAFVERALLVERIAEATGIPVEELIGRAGRFSALPPYRDALGIDGEIWKPLIAIWKYVLVPEFLNQAKQARLAVTHSELDRLLAEPPEAIQWAIAGAFYGAKGPAAILRTAEAWQSGSGQPLSAPGGAFALEKLLLLPSWEALLPEPFQTGDLQIVSMIDAKSLVDEGLAMRHCIGRMAIRCAYQGAHAVSVRAPGGYRLSTALLAIRGLGKVEVLEHRGFGNCGPDPRAEHALSALIARLNAEIGPLALDRLEAGRKLRMKAAGGEDEATRRLYPVYSEDLREWWFRAYVAPHLPQPFRTGGLSLWLDSYGLGRLAARLPPSLESTLARAA